MSESTSNMAGPRSIAIHQMPEPRLDPPRHPCECGNDDLICFEFDSFEFNFDRELKVIPWSGSKEVERRSGRRPPAGTETSSRSRASTVPQ